MRWLVGVGLALVSAASGCMVASSGREPAAVRSLAELARDQGNASTHATAPPEARLPPTQTDRAAFDWSAAPRRGYPDTGEASPSAVIAEPADRSEEDHDGSSDSDETSPPPAPLPQWTADKQGRMNWWRRAAQAGFWKENRPHSLTTAAIATLDEQPRGDVLDGSPQNAQAAFTESRSSPETATTVPAEHVEPLDASHAVPETESPATGQSSDDDAGWQDALRRVRELAEAESPPDAELSEVRWRDLLRSESAVEDPLWRSVRAATGKLLQSESPTDDSAALQDLRRAMELLAARAPLEVRNLAFCTRVDGFGVVRAFPEYRFFPDQEVLLYAEIENVTTGRPDDGGFETRLAGRYQIRNASGETLASETFPEYREVSRTIRRDYFAPYRIYLPRDIAPGRYVLALSMRDALSGKVGEAEVAFEMIAQPAGQQ